MGELLVVTRRELSAMFVSPIAYVVGSLFLALQFGWVVLVLGGLKDGAQADTQPFFGLLAITLLFFAPGLTMRMWSEERRSGTLELLLTFPVSTVRLVLGKFLAGLGFVALLLVLTLIYPVLLSVLGELDWGRTLAGYLGALMLAGAYLAMGMFWSALTRDQIVALLLGMMSLVLLGMASLPTVSALLGRFLPEVVLGALQAISPVEHFASTARGVLDSRDAVYYLVFMGVFLHANTMVLEHRRNRG